jgi:hypothetical protein
LGPDNFQVSLKSTQLIPKANKACIMDIERKTGKYAMFDVAFLIGGTYVASFGVLIRGHSIGSAIWWRLRTACSVLDWIEDYERHEWKVNVGSRVYYVSIQDDSTFLGDDDLLVNLRSAS